MRYRFRGLIRTTGQPVEGHVEAEVEDQAFNTLSEHGIVTETIRPDPPPLNLSRQQQGGFAGAIDSALDTASAQVPFDALADRFRGKNVWVLDRDKIRNRVAQVVDQAIRQAQQNAEPDSAVRERVAEAISGLFKDNRNLTSQANASSAAMDQQIGRLASFIHKAESLLAQMTVAISRIGSLQGGGWGGGAPRRFSSRPGADREEQNAVLLEIFKENLRLRGIEIDAPAEQVAEVGGGEAASVPEAGGAEPMPGEPAVAVAESMAPAAAAEAPAPSDDESAGNPAQ